MPEALSEPAPEGPTDPPIPKGATEPPLSEGHKQPPPISEGSADCPIPKGQTDPPVSSEHKDEDINQSAEEVKATPLIETTPLTEEEAPVPPPRRKRKKKFDKQPSLENLDEVSCKLVMRPSQYYCFVL